MAFWGGKGSDSKIESELSSAASLSAGAHLHSVSLNIVYHVWLLAFSNLRNHFAPEEDIKE